MQQSPTTKGSNRRCPQPRVLDPATYQPNTLLDEFQVFEATGRAVSTLRGDRFHRRGIPYVKLGRLVRYRWADVQAYIIAHRVDPNIPAA